MEWQGPSRQGTVSKQEAMSPAGRQLAQQGQEGSGHLGLQTSQRSPRTQAASLPDLLCPTSQLACASAASRAACRPL